MQQRMRNTMYQCYIMYIETPVFTTLVKNFLVLMQEDTPESPELTFVPVIKLVPVEVKSMEENEDEVFEM